LRRNLSGIYGKVIIPKRRGQRDSSRRDPYVALIADDEAIIRNTLRLALESGGFFVLTASDGEEALRISRKFVGTIDILVSDMVMPKLDGVALYEQVLRERPTMKVLLISAYVNAPLNGVPFLRKPFHLNAFKQCVSEILALPAGGPQRLTPLRGGTTGDLPLIKTARLTFRSKKVAQ
jgi:DNA-binding NtrC family response regulator